MVNDKFHVQSDATMIAGTVLSELESGFKATIKAVQRVASLSVDAGWRESQKYVVASVGDKFVKIVDSRAVGSPAGVTHAQMLGRFGDLDILNSEIMAKLTEYLRLKFDRLQKRVNGVAEKAEEQKQCSRVIL